MVMGFPRPRPVRLAIVSDFELVVAGVEGMLAAHLDRVVVVPLPAQGSMSAGVDVVLWDSSSPRPLGQGDLGSRADRGPVVISFDWTGDPASDGPAGPQNVTCHLSKRLTGLELVEAVEAVCDRPAMGNRVREHGGAARSRDWLGVEQGLTRREAEMLALIARGLSNREIADAAYLSINSVKTHIRTTYRKLGVTRRSQAVGWVLGQGFAAEDRGGSDVTAELVQPGCERIDHRAGLFGRDGRLAVATLAGHREDVDREPRAPGQSP